MKIVDGLWWPDHDTLSHKARWKEHLADLDQTIALCTGRGTVIQAGGAVGIWPERLASEFDEVYTFEADRDQYECLLRNVTSANVKAYNRGLAKGYGRMYVRQGPRGNAAFLDNAARAGDYDAPVVTVDGWFGIDPRQIDLICLDVEGMELDVLRGAMETIKRCRPVVQIEDKHGERYGVKPGDAEAFMQSLGYSLHHVRRYDKTFVPEAA